MTAAEPLATVAPLHRVLAEKVALSSALLSLVGCGDNGEATAPCRADHASLTRSTDCESAKELARREVAELVVSQGQLDWYLDVYQRGYVPLQDHLGFPPQTTAWWRGLHGVTEARAFTAPWLAGHLATGVVAVDDVFSRAYIDTVISSGLSQPTFDFWSSTHVVSTHNVVEALAGVPDLDMTTEYHPVQDGHEFSDAFIEYPTGGRELVNIIYRLGWGECDLLCTGQFSWRVSVTPTTATLVDSWVWGEPPSPEILDAWKQPNPNR